MDMIPTKVNFNNFEARCKSLLGIDAPKISKGKRIYIFGAGGFGKSIANALRVNDYDIAGFIETNPRQKIVDSFPVYSLGDLNAEDFSAQLLVGIYNRNTPLDGLKNVAMTAGFKNIFMPWDIYSQFKNELGWKYWLSGKETILDAIDQIKLTFELLSDEESKKTILNICEFRLGLNHSYASFRHQDQQYFNSMTLPKFENFSNCTYVDCGAYNGDTFLEADNKLPLTAAYLFEPDTANFEQLILAVRQSKISPICIPLAVSNHYQILSFNGTGEGGAISLGGSVNIAAASLDELLPNSIVDFIKFDVEGAEISAVVGAKHLIQRSRPVLAFSLYHRPTDLWEIPVLISSYCREYKFYIRQHFDNSFDSVFYAIPQ
jgi:FkbM family methyltransferase